MELPFNSAKLDRLMEEADVSLVLAGTRHNVRYLSGGYYYHFHANSTRMGRSQYLPFVGIPRKRIADSFYVGRAEERGQIESEGLWIPNIVEAVRGTVSAAEGAAKAIESLGLESARIGVELPFLPADAYLALRGALPQAELVDATPIFDELRAVKSDSELLILRNVYARVAEAIKAAFNSSRPGDTTRRIAERVELEMAKRGVSFLFAFVCAGPGFLRAPSSAVWENGQVLHIDAGGAQGDYIADICRMGCIGEPSALANEVYSACIEVQNRVRSRIRAGVPCRDIVEEGQKASRRYGFSSHARFVVHSIGMVPYEQPAFSLDNSRALEAGMVLSVETDFLHPDVGHVKIEDAVAVTDTSCEGLGDLGREWQIVPPGSTPPVK
jgi:Xaa-Pro dipeptidase